MILLLYTAIWFIMGVIGCYLWWVLHDKKKATYDVSDILVCGIFGGVNFLAVFLAYLHYIDWSFMKKVVLKSEIK